MQLTDDEFEQQFRDTNLLKKQFTHDAHLRLAWIHVTKYGEEKAMQNLRTQIRAYVAKLGLEDKYNDKTTIAGVKLISARIQEKGHSSFPEFIESNPDLQSNFGELIKQYLNR
jgi:hypothetical protein